MIADKKSPSIIFAKHMTYEKHIKEFVCNNTSFTEDEYDRNYRVELYLDSKGMIEHGVVDEIVTEIM